jgi:hypothetical protein
MTYVGKVGELVLHRTSCCLFAVIRQLSSVDKFVIVEKNCCKIHHVCLQPVVSLDINVETWNIYVYTTLKFTSFML